jgi:hypothetical protein
MICDCFYCQLENLFIDDEEFSEEDTPIYEEEGYGPEEPELDEPGDDDPEEKVFTLSESPLDHPMERRARALQMALNHTSVDYPAERVVGMAAKFLEFIETGQVYNGKVTVH